MLQISSGKFYEVSEPDKLYITQHRGVLYTNYRFFHDRITTTLGDILPAARWGDLQTIVCEVTERLPNPDGQMHAGQIISVGPDVFIQDFAALVSFGMNITCTPDQNLAQRLIVSQRPSLGTSALPRQHIQRMFDTSIDYRSDDFDQLRLLADKLIDLDRKSYSCVMRSIRRYVTAMHRLADDLDLAYTLLVASIESLAQEFDKFTPLWEDYADQKRKPIDEALNGVGDDVCNRVRQAILNTEHIALKRRFKEFTLNYIQPTFFRDDALGQSLPIGRTELDIALKNAYDLRSEHIHSLKPLPKLLTSSTTQNDTIFVEGKCFLTFQGLARVARHIILEFIKQSPKSGYEKFDYTSDYPNLLQMQMAPEYWIWNSDSYSIETSYQVLNGFLTQLTNHIIDPSKQFSDLRQVLKKIESIVANLKKRVEKMPILALYILFTQYLPMEEQKANQAFISKYLHDFNDATIESLLVHFLLGEQKPNWSLEEIGRLLEDYRKQRFYKKGMNAGSLIGAALILWVAEMYRASNNEAHTRQLIAQAVEEYPQQKNLYVFEKELPHDSIPEIKCWHILLPHLKTQETNTPSEFKH